MSNSKVEVEPMSNYPHIPAEIPGVRLESDLQPENIAVQNKPVLSMSHLAAAAHTNAGLTPTIMASQATGMAPTHNAIDFTNEDDDADEDVCVEDVSDNKDDDDDDNDTQKNETQEPVISENYGRGMRIRKQPELYEPSMSGQSYKTGVNNLCYSGTRYSLSEITPGDGEILIFKHFAKPPRQNRIKTG